MDLFPEPPRWMDSDLVAFDDSVRRFLADKFPEVRMQGFREAGSVDVAAWNEVAEAGLLGLCIPEAYGGPGGDFRHDAILTNRLMKAGGDGFAAPLHNAICAPYILHYGTDEQKQRWLPKCVTGELRFAIAMTEPGAGSDLRGIRTTAKPSGDGFVINGQKTFITNGQLANMIIVVAKTDPEAGSGAISLFAVETDKAPGFRRGRKLDKIGVDMGDTSELFFDDVQVGRDALIGGQEGRGLYQLMEQLPQERLLIAIESLSIIEMALETTLEYVRERKAFGKRLLDLQATQFRLAECKTEARVARSFVDECVQLCFDGKLDAETASMAKYWGSECAQRVVDSCQQLFGGYGYMNEYTIARLYRDVRVKRVYGGATEIMKLLIARGLEA